MVQAAKQSTTGAMFGGHHTSGRVLIVDDEPDVRKVVSMTLEKAGYDVVEAEDGEQAVQEIKSGENPLLLDVILTKAQRPGSHTIFPKRISPCVCNRAHGISGSEYGHLVNAERSDRLFGQTG